MLKAIGWSKGGQRLAWRDLLEMTKPKVVLLMLVTALVGMALASPGMIVPRVLILGLAGIGLMAGAAAAVNHLLDRQIDLKMARTHHRPVATGRVSPLQGGVFALALGSLGFFLLYGFINPLTAWLTLASLVGYALIYTGFLKRATPQNIVIGGLAGAMPPLLGWTSVTGDLHGHGWLLVIIIFTWTPPHFWALAIHRRDEYAKAAIPMLPVTHGVAYTKTSILLYSFLLVIACMLPVLVGMSGALYLVGSTGLSLWFLVRAWQLKFAPRPDSAIKLFLLSIWQLLALFLLILADHYLGIWL
ncbi:protoheme IX farnesyltransferase [Ferrimonas sediminicola]|uniref:Protoheme IX farnesyltransferase n=1 Tax=Ferrimonas sediminicola TaxID=2569538 RepID=A0A4U1BC63_9GAMM|nr:heme o synthase [Ferrimonas sediminicola]TKB47621.1 protoheme IX farnesyltransferase [Ferrimonas sediminicola]